MLAYNPQSFLSTNQRITLSFTVCVDTHEIPHSCVYPYLVLFVLNTILLFMFVSILPLNIYTRKD